MTSLKQKISLIPFSIEHRYSPYKRRRFENRSDQTFCILLIKDVLSVNLHSVTWPIVLLLLLLLPPPIRRMLCDHSLSFFYSFCHSVNRITDERGNGSIEELFILGHLPLMTPMTQPLVMNDVISDVIANTPLTHSYSYTV